MEKISTSRHLKGLESKNYDDYLLHKPTKTEVEASITNALEKHLYWLMLGNKRLPADRQAIYLTNEKFKKLLEGVLSSEPTKIRCDHILQKIANHYVRLKVLEKAKQLSDKEKQEKQNIVQQIGKLKKQVGQLIVTVDDRTLEFAEMMVFVGMGYITAAFKALDNWTAFGRKYVEPLDSNSLLTNAVIDEIKKANKIKKQLQELEAPKKKF